MTGQKPGGTVDFAYLEGFAAGDRGVVREVLTMFGEQAPGWDAGLTPADAGWRDVVHTIKGAARGIGANGLGDVCAACEAAGEDDLPAVRAALEAALADIRAYLAAA